MQEFLFLAVSEKSVITVFVNAIICYYNSDMNINKESTILITCSPGLVDCLQSEVESLGYQTFNPHKAGLEIRGTIVDCMKLNLNLRTAFNVLYLFKEFKSKNPDQLYRYLMSLNWADIIGEDEYFTVISRADNPSIKHTAFPSMKVKDAIVDSIAKAKGKRPDSGSERNNVVLNFYWKDNDCWIYINTSGNKLADRGYRKMPHSAPMQETLAAGVLLTAGYDGSMPLVCPMCGSGTLAIEAALISMNKSAGLLRSNYGFAHLKDFDKNLWQEMRKNALKAAKKTLAFPIIATDIDDKAIYAAKQNAKTAGVDHLIEFAICDFAETKIPDTPGMVILNPEYGIRLSETKELEGTYKRIGDFFKQKCQGYACYIFTGNMDLAKKVGLRTSKKILFFNGTIECRLLRYDIYAGTKKQS